MQRMNTSHGRRSGVSTRFSGNGKIFIIIGILILAAIIGFTIINPLKKEKRIVGAVVSNAQGCAQIGSQMLYYGGSAADAAIATLLCEGVLLPSCLGLGGGFIATIYTKKTRKIETLIARPSAPAASDAKMFVGQKQITGAKAIAVPGELLGYHELHKKHGNLPWKMLFQPSIRLCKFGQNVSSYLSRRIQTRKDEIMREPSLANSFLKNYHKYYQRGDILKRLKLGTTLETIAEKGAKEFYNGGKLGKMFIKDIQEMGGIITERDLREYRVRWKNKHHIMAKITDDYTLYTTPLPSSGIMLSFIFNVLAKLYTKNHEIYWHRIIEAVKHAYGQRTKLGDFEKDPEMSESIKEVYERLMNPSFINLTRSLIFDNKTFEDIGYYGAKFADFKDYGTGNVVVLAPNGDAISITSTINNEFGAMKRSIRTGIVLNNEMDSFSTPGFVTSYLYPASVTNYIKPGKMPMSSMCPTIVLDKMGNVRMLVGSAGGSYIPTAITVAIIKYLILNETLAEAVDGWRFHHQLVPMKLEVEFQTPKNLKKYFQNAGHNLKTLFESGSVWSQLTAIGVRDGIIEPYCDRRRFGSVATVER